MARAGVEEEVVEPNVFVVVQIRPGSQCQLSANCGSSVLGSHCHKAVLSPVALMCSLRGAELASRRSVLLEAFVRCGIVE